MDLELENVIWAFGLKVCLEFSRRRKKKILRKKKLIGGYFNPYKMHNT